MSILPLLKTGGEEQASLLPSRFGIGVFSPPPPENGRGGGPPFSQESRVSCIFSPRFARKS